MATNNPNNPPNNPGGNNSFQNNPLQDVASIQSSLGGAADEFKEFHETAKLTSTEIKNIISLSTELNNLFKETLNFQAKIGKEYLKISSIQREINRYEEQSEKINEKINILKAKTTSAQHTQADKAIKNYKSIESLNKKILDASKEVLKTEKEIAAIKAKGGTIDPSLTRTLTNKKALLKRRTNSLSIEELALNQNLTGKDNAESSRIKQLAMLGFQRHVTAEMAQDLKAQVPAIIAANKQFEKQQKQLGSLAAIMKGISKIPILGNLIDTEKILGVMKDKMDKTGSSWKTFGAGMKATFSEIGRLLTDPLVVAGILLDLIGKLVKGVFEFDKNITDTANSLGVSKKFTQEIYKDFENITINSLRVNEHLNNSLLSIQNQGKAMNELNAQFGTAVAFSNQQIQDQIFLTKQMGLSEDVAKGIMRYSVITGKSTNDILKTINKQNDGLLSYKKVIGEVSKISGQLLAQYKGSPEALAKAVVMADKLGISLEQAKKQSDFLLNFQGSIESEMEAELITGKQLNLERARALALMGDSAGAAKEMLQQVGSFSDYSKLNVIQQQSLAKAMGMTADELTNALREQETLTALGAKSKEDLVAQYNHYKDINDQRSLAILKQQILSKQNGDMLLDNISQLSLQHLFLELLRLSFLVEFLINISSKCNDQYQISSDGCQLEV